MRSTQSTFLLGSPGDRLILPRPLLGRREISVLAISHLLDQPDGCSTAAVKATHLIKALRPGRNSR